jgi:SAM-dependent methyltransferase
MDLSPDGVQSTAKWALQEGLNVKVRQGDMLTLPYGDASFDSLFAYHVISHTDTPGASKIISEIRRVVKPGGEIYLSLCSKDTWAYKEAGYPVIDENTVRKTDGAEVDVPHFFVNLDDILTLFQAFDLVNVRHVDDCYFEGQKRNSKHYFLLARRV